MAPRADGRGRARLLRLTLVLVGLLLVGLPATPAATQGAPTDDSDAAAVAGLGGAPSDLANDHIPDLAFPPADSSDMSPHPELAVTASRTRLILGFTPTATVAQANAALSAAGVSVVGGLPALGLLLAA